LIGYLEVLVADNALFAAEPAWVRTDADCYARVVNVYQAMGGWPGRCRRFADAAADRSHAASAHQKKRPQALYGWRPPEPT
jgi:outer membrane protein TolC